MPHSTIFTSTDPYEHQKAVRTAAFEMVVTSAGEFRGEITRIDLGRLWVQRGRESLSRVIYTATHSDRIGITFLADPQQAPMHHTGMEVSYGSIVFRAAGSEHHLNSSTASHWASMSLSPEDWATAGLAIAGRHLSVPKANQLIRPPPSLMNRLMRLHAAAGDLAASTPDLIAHPEVAKALEQELIDGMVRCLTEGSAEHIFGGHQGASVMRRFQRMIEANPSKPLYLTEVCAALGVTSRTLRLHCRQHLGMSPHRYLMLRRMTLARRALALADPATQTVTHVATEFGFWELGRFSVAFRDLFGESPSVTLKRPA